jgi:uncharacterized membrane protein
MSARTVVRVNVIIFSPLAMSNVVRWTIEVDLLISIFMRIVTWTRSHLNRLVSLLANRLIFGIESEVSIFLMSAGTVVRVNHLFFSTLAISNIVCWTIEVNLLICILMRVMSRSRSNLNRFISLLANRLIFGIESKVAMFLMSARAIVRVNHLILSSFTSSNEVSWSIKVD